MDADTVEKIDILFFQKIMLYDDLLRCFKQERDALIRIDLDSLWRISKDKEAICRKLIDIRKAIIDAIDFSNQKGADLNQLMALIPRPHKAHFVKPYLRLIELKKEIEELKNENMRHINDSLQFVEDVLSIFTGQAASDKTYNHRCRLNHSKTPLTIHREM